MVIPKGLLNLAALPTASVEPEDPEPARVVTAPVEITILRIELLFASAR